MRGLTDSGLFLWPACLLGFSVVYLPSACVPAAESGCRGTAWEPQANLRPSPSLLLATSLLYESTYFISYTYLSHIRVLGVALCCEPASPTWVLSSAVRLQMLAKYPTMEFLPNTCSKLQNQLVDCRVSRWRASVSKLIISHALR